MKEDKLMKTKEVAEYLNVSEQHIFNMRKKKNGIPYVQVGNNIRYRKEDIDQWLKENSEE